MSTVDSFEGHELVVADDGSIPAEQLQSLGLPAGTHLRVVETAHGRSSDPLAGSLPHFPDLGWEDFERASDLARGDAAASCR